MTPRLLIVLIITCLMMSRAWALTVFEVKDIRVEGLQRIAVGTVFNYLPITVGETLDEKRAADAIRALFKTGFFNDVKLGQDDGVLVVTVTERPSIADIKIAGNKDISTDQLTEALEQIGLAKGRVFDRSLLDKVEQELQRQYFSRGKYSVRITSTVKDLERNRVDIAIDVVEGSVAKLVQINIVGNSAFNEDQLLDQFELDPDTTFSLFSSADQYSKQKLAADLEALRSYYLDRGFINFSIDSTQVSITPNKQEVFITINVLEGDRYSVSEVKVTGDTVVPAEELKKLITIKAGNVFSRKLVTESTAAIGERLGNEGYAFSNVNTIPDIDKENKKVALTFFVDPGKRVYVHRINMSGNEKTRDEVLRREVRQMESAAISTEKVNRSRVRLQRLTFIEEVTVETPPVPGTEDQVDVNFSVVERSAGSLQAGMGYSQSQGLFLSGSISHSNFLGGGKRVNAEINTSDVNTTYSFSYTNPYYTLDGVSRGFRAYYREQNDPLRNTAAYNSDSYGSEINYGVPIDEFRSVRAALGYEHTLLKVNSKTPDAYRDFIAANTNEFDLFKLSLGWSYDSRNRGIFADRGLFQSFSTELIIPGSELEYYTVSSRTQLYAPLTQNLTLLLSGDIGYGDNYGETTQLPFFEHYFAGGGRTVRGYEVNSLGPRQGDQALGGTFKVVGNTEIIFPIPFQPDLKSLRLSTFFDIGNVFADSETFEVSQLRQSVGIGAIWLSPLGPISLSFAKALNAQEEDRTEIFQFSLGAPLY